MRRLSGWTRLWIILAVIMWGWGGWMLAQTSAPILDSAYDHCSAPGLRPQDMMGTRLCEGGGLGFSCEQLEEMERECYASYREGTPAYAEMEARNEQTMRGFYSDMAVRGAVVFMAPFIVALFVWLGAALVRWVWRGFRPQTT